MVGCRKAQGRWSIKQRESAVLNSFGSVLLGDENVEFQHGSKYLLHVLDWRVTAAAASLCGVQAAPPCWTVKLYSRWCKQHSFSQAINDHPSRTFTMGDAWRRPMKSCKTKLISRKHYQNFISRTLSGHQCCPWHHTVKLISCSTDLYQ